LKGIYVRVKINNKLLALAPKRKELIADCLQMTLFGEKCG
jgi:hypothetical protein